MARMRIRVMLSARLQLEAPYPVRDRPPDPSFLNLISSRGKPNASRLNLYSNPVNSNSSRLNLYSSRLNPNSSRLNLNPRSRKFEFQPLESQFTPVESQFKPGEFEFQPLGSQSKAQESPAWPEVACRSWSPIVTRSRRRCYPAEESARSIAYAGVSTGSRSRILWNIPGS